VVGLTAPAAAGYLMCLSCFGRPFSNPEDSPDP